MLQLSNISTPITSSGKHNLLTLMIFQPLPEIKYYFKQSACASPTSLSSNHSLTSCNITQKGCMESIGWHRDLKKCVPTFHSTRNWSWAVWLQSIPSQHGSLKFVLILSSPSTSILSLYMLPLKFCRSISFL
jgi:hypothetical protein